MKNVMRKGWIATLGLVTGGVMLFSLQTVEAADAQGSAVIEISPALTVLELDFIDFGGVIPGLANTTLTLDPANAAQTTLTIDGGDGTPLTGTAARGQWSVTGYAGASVEVTLAILADFDGTGVTLDEVVINTDQSGNATGATGHTGQLIPITGELIVYAGGTVTVEPTASQGVQTATLEMVANYE